MIPFWRTVSDVVEPEASRDWLSEDQWQAVIQQLRKRPLDFNGPERRDRRAPRHEVIKRCLLRVEHRGRVLGILSVRSRNVSSTGLCVVHAGRVPRYRQATIAIETISGEGLVVSGRTVWCRRVRGVQPVTHEIGIAFDEPIDVRALLGPSDPGGEGPASHVA